MTVKAWHWLQKDRRLRYGTKEIVEAGKTYRHDDDLVLCNSGLHASKRITDALRYAPGPVVCRVEMGGKFVHGDDKLVATERKVLWMLDATDILWAFARRCALEDRKSVV